MREQLAKAMAETSGQMTRARAEWWVAKGQRALGKIGSAWKSMRRNLAEYRRCLRAIKTGRAWIPLGYRNFEDCGLAVFGKARSQLYRDLKAAEINEDIVPNGDITIIPESICRILSILETQEERREVATSLYRDGKKPTTAIAKSSVLDRLRSSATPRAEKVSLAREEEARQQARAERGEARANVRHAIPMDECYARGLKRLEQAIDDFTRAGRHAVKIDVEHAKAGIEILVLKIQAKTDPLVDRWLPDYRAKRRKPGAAAITRSIRRSTSRRSSGPAASCRWSPACSPDESRGGGRRRI